MQAGRAALAAEDVHTALFWFDLVRTWAPSSLQAEVDLCRAAGAMPALSVRHPLAPLWLCYNVPSGSSCSSHPSLAERSSWRAPGHNKLPLTAAVGDELLCCAVLEELPQIPAQEAGDPRAGDNAAPAAGTGDTEAEVEARASMSEAYLNLSAGKHKVCRCAGS